MQPGGGNTKETAGPLSVSRGDGQRPEIALSFDDGPSRWTAEIAAVFEQHDYHATFFLLFDPVMERAGPGDIVCLHDGISSDKRDTDSRDPTAEAVRQLVPALLESGLRPVTVSRLLDEMNPPN